MKGPSRPTTLAATAGAAAALLLSSCALPSADACRMMCNEGVASYTVYEIDARLIPPPRNAWERRAPSIPYQPPLLGPGPTLTAPRIAGSSALVRSPYTYPSRFVDVGGAAPGTVVICPHTMKPFIVPSTAGYAYSTSGGRVAASK